MSPGSAPSLAEIGRRLDDLARQLDRFILAPVYEADKTTDAVQMRGIEAEQHSQAKRLEALADRLDEGLREQTARLDKVEDRRRQDRALLLGSLVLPLMVALLTALLLGRA